MTIHRVVKQRSQAVWDRAREAYLAGEPANSVARRFDVGYSNLRHRAHVEGWTRKAALVATEDEAAEEGVRLAGRADPFDRPAPETLTEIAPGQAMDTAIRRASALLAAGRPMEAAATLKAVEALGRYAGAAESGPPTQTDKPALTDEEDINIEAAYRAAWEARNLEIQMKACALAADLVSERGSHQADHVAFALRWRAEMLGRAIAAADQQRDFDNATHPLGRLEDGSLRSGREIVDHIYQYTRWRMRGIAGLTGLAPDERARRNREAIPPQPIRP